MSESILAIYEFKQLIQYSKEGTYIKLYASAMIDLNIVYEDFVECVISYQAGYGDYIVKFDWPFNNTVMHSLGLHAQYSTNFQRIEFDGNALTIKLDNGEIILSKGEL